MTKMKLLAIAALLTSTVATPVLARDAKDMTQRPAATKHLRHHAVNRDMNRDRNFDANASYQRRDTGFWPADAAAGIVGGAIGTAGAIASAPFRGGYDDSYAYDEGYQGRYDNQPLGYNSGYAYNDGYAINGGYAQQSYAQRNNFQCQPGTMTRLEDGRMHLCQ